MKIVKINGRQFEIGGVRRPYKLRSSFCLLGHYEAGNRSKAREWLDRIKELGFDGPRVFGENQHWFDSPGPFYGNPATTTKATALTDYNGVNSKKPLRPGYGNMVAQFVEDLVDRDLVAEFSCVATLKTVLSEGEVGHVLNKFAQMGRDVVGADSPIIWETINEWESHSPVTPREADNMVRRFRRSDPDLPSHHNFPRALISASAGGGGGVWGLKRSGVYDTHHNYHFPRKHNSFTGEDGEHIRETLNRLRSSIPDTNNETIHYMTQKQYDQWIKKIPKWHGLSCTDAAGFVEYIGDHLESAWSVCFHDLVGQMTEPGEPITRAEELFALRYGGEVPNQTARPFDRVISQAYVDILARNPDPGGLASYAAAMGGGLSEAGMREAIIRDAENMKDWSPVELEAVAFRTELVELATVELEEGDDQAAEEGPGFKGPPTREETKGGPE